MSTDINKIAADHPLRSKDLPWYQSSCEKKLTPEIQKFFEEYSGIPPSELAAHVYRIRDIGWEAFPWPCVGGFWFVNFGLRRHPQYQKLLSFLKQPNASTGEDSKAAAATFLDLGTCFGQDLRALHYDGVPISSLYGSDLSPQFEEAGKQLFRDGDRIPSDHFLTADIFDTDPNSALGRTAGTWSVVHISMFLHIFNLEKMEKACGIILKLLRPEPGSFVIGTSTGSLKAYEMVVPSPTVDPNDKMVVWRHNRETMIDMWKRVGEQNGVELKVWADYDMNEVKEREKNISEDPEWEKKNRFFTGTEERRIFFLVERI